MAVQQTVDAKAKLGRDDALRLASDASTIIIVKNKKVLTFSIKKNRPDDDALLAQMLGPTGNLRAPTIRMGKTLLVGFDEQTYRALL